MEVLCLNFCDIEEEGGNNEGYILAGGNNKKINAYSIRTGLLRAEMAGHEDSVTCIAVNGNIMITGSDDMSIRLWNLLSFSYAGDLGHHEERKLLFMIFF